jgi:hypothetical protein
MTHYNEIKKELANEITDVNLPEFDMVYAKCYVKAVSNNTHNGYDAKEVLKPIIKDLISKFYATRQPKTKFGKLLKNIWIFLK